MTVMTCRHLGSDIHIVLVHLQVREYGMTPQIFHLGVHIHRETPTICPLRKQFIAILDRVMQENKPTVTQISPLQENEALVILTNHHHGNEAIMIPTTHHRGNTINQG